MTNARIYHNPRCSKSRQTLQLLLDRDIDPDVIEYLKTPPTASELASILDALGLEPQDIVRRGEALFKELGLANAAHNRDEWIDVLVANPKLIERPIVVTDRGARIGRPPQKVLDILE